MPPTAIEFRPDASAGMVREAVRGHTASRYFGIDCSAEVGLWTAWSTATGLPALGEAFGGGYDGLVCLERRPTRDSDSFVRVECVYGDRQPAGNFPTLPSGQSYTVRAQSDQTIQIGSAYNLIAAADQALQEPIQRLVGQTTLEVHRFYAANPEPTLDVARWNTLAWNRNVNAATVTLPKLYMLNVTLAVTAGKLRYEGWRYPVREGNLLRVVHLLSVSPTDWTVAVTAKQIGAPAQSRIYRVYESASFAGIWD